MMTCAIDIARLRRGEMTLEEQYKEETGNESKYGEEIGIWGAAAGEYSKYYVAWLEATLDLEHRRRVAAEAVILCRECYTVDRVNELIKNWQSIIKEAGE